MAKKPVLRIKRGDDFKLDLTVTDTNNSAALAAKAAMDAAQKAYDDAIEADPQVSQDIIDTQTALNAAILAYNEAILVDISTWTITSQMAWCGQIAATFNVVIIDPLAGAFTISAPYQVTEQWIPRTYAADVQFTRPQGKVSSQTFAIEVMKDITHV